MRLFAVPSGAAAARGRPAPPVSLLKFKTILLGFYSFLRLVRGFGHILRLPVFLFSDRSGAALIIAGCPGASWEQQHCCYRTKHQEISADLRHD